MSDIDFYYDVVCPYAYLGACKIQKLNANINWNPILLGGLFRYNKSPDVPAHSWAMSKARYGLNDLMREAEKQGKKLKYHPRHPVRTVEAMRLISMLSPEDIPRVSLRIFAAYWEEGQDISDRSVLNSIAQELGIPTNLFDAPAAKEKLFEQTKKAHDRGVFGVPTMANDTRIWWGQDRIHLVAQSFGEKRKELAKGMIPQDTIIEFFHDFASPFSYLGAMQIPKIEKKYGIKITLKPILLGALFRNIGTPDVPIFAMSKPKQRYMMQDLQDASEFWNTPFSFPKNFPIRSILPLRIAILAPKCTYDIYESMWAKGIDITNPEELKKIAHAHGYDWNELEKQIPRAKEILKENTTRAQSLGVCGVPSWIANDQLWWGQDRVHDLVQSLIRDSSSL